MPTHADAAHVPLPEVPGGGEGLGMVKVAETALKVCPAGGAVSTAPAQLELYWTFEMLPSGPLVVCVAPRGIRGCDCPERAERRWSWPLGASRIAVANRTLLKRMVDNFMLGSGELFGEEKWEFLKLELRLGTGILRTGRLWPGDCGL